MAFLLSLKEVIRPATVIEPARLSARLGATITLVSETLQHTGSFKFRAAFNVAANVPQQKLIAASSGNFGQALAYACALLGKTCIVVMPDSSAAVKIEAVQAYGAMVELVDVSTKGRGERVQELAAEHPEAYVASAYDDPLVIEGNATLAEEICALGRHFDFLLVPIGGGGLSAGIVSGIQSCGRNIRMHGAEPELANDAARSLRSGRLVADSQESTTIADGARVMSLGKHNWSLLRNGLWDIIEVPEDRIEEAVRILFSLANLKAEPTGALAVGALLTQPDRFHGKSVCCVVSGGNVDPFLYQQILSPLTMQTPSR